MTTAMFACPELDTSALQVANLAECQSLLVSISKVEERGFIWRGIVLREIERRELWSDGYTSMHDWMIKAAPYSIRDCYAAMSAVDDLKDVPVDDLAAMPRCNVTLLQELSTAIRTDSETIEAAKTMGEDEFVAHVQARHPNQHVQKRVKPTLRLTDPVRDALDEYAKHYPDVLDRQGQLEGLLIDWLQEVRP